MTSEFVVLSSERRRPGKNRKQKENKTRIAIKKIKTPLNLLRARRRSRASNFCLLIFKLGPEKWWVLYGDQFYPELDLKFQPYWEVGCFCLCFRFEFCKILISIGKLCLVNDKWGAQRLSKFCGRPTGIYSFYSHLLTRKRRSRWKLKYLLIKTYLSI